MIFHRANTLMTSTTGTAIKIIICFTAVSDDFAAAMATDRSQFMNRALEAIKGMFRSRRNNFK